MPARPHRLARIADTQLRLQLMITYEQLATAGVIRKRLAARAWERLLRDADAEDRVAATLTLLETQQVHHEFRPGISDELVALAIHEATPQQVNEFVFLVDWTPAVTQAIAAVTGGVRRRIPAELEILRWPDPDHGETEVSVECTPAMLLAEADLENRAQLVDSYQCLWAYGIIDAALPAERVAEALTHLLAQGDVVSFNRLLELVPEGTTDHPVVATALDAALEQDTAVTRVPAVTASYATIAPATRWRGTAVA